MRTRRTGTEGRTYPPRTRGAFEKRFWSKVEKTDTCWNWMGFRLEGYGKYTADELGGTKSTHRVAYELLVGPIPEGLSLDHLCRNRACCNPDHLEPVTPGENSRRSPLVVKTFCPRGHRYVPGSYYEYDWQGGRQCKECRRDQQLDWQAKVGRTTASFLCPFCGEERNVTNRARHIRRMHPERADILRRYRFVTPPP